MSPTPSPEQRPPLRQQMSSLWPSIHSLLRLYPLLRLLHSPPHLLRLPLPHPPCHHVPRPFLPHCRCRAPCPCLHGGGWQANPVRQQRRGGWGTTASSAGTRPSLNRPARGAVAWLQVLKSIPSCCSYCRPSHRAHSLRATAKPRRAARMMQRCTRASSRDSRRVRLPD